MMLLREFGTTGLQTSAIGYGAGAIGATEVSEGQAEALLNGALDLGINLIDTARGYGLSEERIGKYISHRRDDYVLSTKVGYGVEGHQDWTYSCIIAGVERALTLMKTDVLDIVHLHSCPAAVLKDGSVIDALDELKHQQKIRVKAYSGENDDLSLAVHSNRFDSIMASLNFCDQHIIDNQLPRAKERGMGMIAKRPIANAPWRFSERPTGHYAEAYWARMHAMAIDFGMSELEMAIRFSVFTYGVDTAIIGSINLEHIAANIGQVNAGPLEQELLTTIRGRFQACDQNWQGQL
ncbi:MULTISPECIES: aldo/keto reductase [unclassified Agarivorans]|uniref:aldo/keto reductase n=1 Tax=unclassified Agarivorans TaxID=2636026 RepID=UPI0026E24644|nr:MULTISPECIES: aldo/keto reductase [unclassified Agarivorans]MDO6687079.1 aldo/keto reductase [Agarivorans sp. 3_MG-2023]MDO6713509.1 aldo/keto reductase [Agarivorans sp. 2_MG-2023]